MLYEDVLLGRPRTSKYCFIVKKRYLADINAVGSRHKLKKNSDELKKNMVLLSVSIVPSAKLLQKNNKKYRNVFSLPIREGGLKLLILKTTVSSTVKSLTPMPEAELKRQHIKHELKWKKILITNRQRRELRAN